MIGRRPLIEWTWRAAIATRWPVIVATDDEEIAGIARDFGADVQMTGECANGTERCAEAVARRHLDCEIVVNWQGDSPLCPPEYASALVDRLAADPTADLATPVFRCDHATERRLRADQVAGIKGATTAAISRSGRALYFSKAILSPPHFHIGLYAYRREALEAYGRSECELEAAEGLEQLRFLDLGLEIAACPVPARPIWEVNNPGDVEFVAVLLEAFS